NVAVVGVHRDEVANLAGHINAVAGEDGRTGGGADFVVPKLDGSARHNDRIGVGGRDVRNPERDHLARLVGRAVNGDDFVIIVQKHGRIDARLEHFNAENWVASQSVDA